MVLGGERESMSFQTLNKLLKSLKEQPSEVCVRVNEQSIPSNSLQEFIQVAIHSVKQYIYDN